MGTNACYGPSRCSIASHTVPSQLGSTIAFGIRVASSRSSDRRSGSDGAIRPRPEEPSRRPVLRASSLRSYPRRESHRSHRIPSTCLAEEFPGLRGVEGRVFRVRLTKNLPLIRRERAREGSSSAHGPRTLTVLASAPQIHRKTTKGYSKIAMGRSRSWEGEELDRMASCSTDRRGEIPVLGKRALATKVLASDWRTRGSLKRDGNGLLRTAGRGKERHGRPTTQSVPKTGAQMPPGTCGRTSNEPDVQREAKQSNWTEADATRRCLRGSRQRTKIQAIEHVQKSTSNSCPKPMRC